MEAFPLSCRDNLSKIEYYDTKPWQPYPLHLGDNQFETTYKIQNLFVMIIIKLMIYFKNCGFFTNLSGTYKELYCKGH